MRFLVVGAGATGGYFGGRLLEAGRDVTFLVRPGRAEQLAATGLAIRSPHGDADLPAPTVLADRLHDAFDVVLLSCKAYDLDAAIAALAPAVGADTAILPLLNGMRHLDTLDARFGADRVLGGACMISATLDAEGRVMHLNDSHGLVFGERDASRSARAEAVAAAFAGAKFDGRLSDDILQDMWEKWVFIAALAGITTLMRATLGDIVASGGAALSAALLEECASIAAAEGHAPRADRMAGMRGFFSAPGSFVAASMLRDIERGARPEADQILGDLWRRAGADAEREAPLLRLAVAQAKAYEARREREQTEGGATVGRSP